MVVQAWVGKGTLACETLKYKMPIQNENNDKCITYRCFCCKKNKMCYHRTNEEGIL